MVSTVGKARSSPSPSGKAKTLFDVRSAGVIRSVRLELFSVDSQIVDNLFIRITTDGVITAALPVSMFFGGYRNADMTNAKGGPAGYDGKNLYCCFPMPFWQSMKIELLNYGTTTIRMEMPGGA